MLWEMLESGGGHGSCSTPACLAGTTLEVYSTARKEEKLGVPDKDLIWFIHRHTPPRMGRLGSPPHPSCRVALDFSRWTRSQVLGGLGPPSSWGCNCQTQPGGATGAMQDGTVGKRPL